MTPELDRNLIQMEKSYILTHFGRILYRIEVSHMETMQKVSMTILRTVDNVKIKLQLY